MSFESVLRAPENERWIAAVKGELNSYFMSWERECSTSFLSHVRVQIGQNNWSPKRASVTQAMSSINSHQLLSLISGAASHPAFDSLPEQSRLAGVRAYDLYRDTHFCAVGRQPVLRTRCFSFVVISPPSRRGRGCRPAAGAARRVRGAGSYDRRYGRHGSGAAAGPGSRS